jgi:Zn-finger nucleic acid-binding protein
MAHRDEFAGCPSCSTGLEPRGTRLMCGECGGVLVTAADLEAMMNEMSPDDERPLDRRLLPGSGTPRECPRCPAKMNPVSMYGIALDHCAEHGVWFDGEELAKTLNANGQSYAARQFDERETGTGLGGVLGSTIRALFAPWIRKKKLEADIAATSPKSAKPESKG